MYIFIYTYILECTRHHASVTLPTYIVDYISAALNYNSADGLRNLSLTMKGNTHGY